MRHRENRGADLKSTGAGGAFEPAPTTRPTTSSRSKSAGWVLNRWSEPTVTVLEEDKRTYRLGAAGK